MPSSNHKQTQHRASLQAEMMSVNLNLTDDERWHLQWTYERSWESILETRSHSPVMLDARGFTLLQMRWRVDSEVNTLGLMVRVRIRMEHLLPEYHILNDREPTTISKAISPEKHEGRAL